MGSCLSSADHATESLPATEKQASATQPEEAMGDDIGDFVLKKRRPGCTGEKEDYQVCPWPLPRLVFRGSGPS